MTGWTGYQLEEGVSPLVKLNVKIITLLMLNNNTKLWKTKPSYISTIVQSEYINKYFQINHIDNDNDNKLFMFTISEE